MCWERKGDFAYLYSCAVGLGVMGIGVPQLRQQVLVKAGMQAREEYLKVSCPDFRFFNNGDPGVMCRNIQSWRNRRQAH